ncbi:MAG: FtsX-like permease family protein [Lachnospiraceae bacterium]|nr:FtsX-like permease family protein [Lachnospiraceae bacterium]
MNIINRFTLQSIKRNKVRTFVTIIGIILSTAMFTGITSLIYSFQAFMVDLEVADYGVWEGRFTGISWEQSKELCEDKEITNSTVIKNIGYAQLENCLNEDKPYLCIQTLQDNVTDLFPIQIVEGRMPESDDEILIPSHLSDNGGISYQVGDTLNLNVGTRLLADGETIGLQYDMYTGTEEKLEGVTQKKYTVVGVCDRPRMEDFLSPGYTAFVPDNGKDAAISCDVFFQVKDAKNIETLLKSYKKEFKKESPKTDFLVHSELLRMQGKSSGRTYNKILWSMGSILIIIIMVASISLIYNAISISVSERTKDFGLLKSIGATKKQIRKSVLFEALFLCLIGIPIGIGSGLIGIGITLHYVANLILPFLNVSESVELKLTVSAFAILSAAAIALVTVLLSSLIPARRAMKMPAIQALMESNEIRLKRRKLRTSRLTYRLFGLEGMLANKNFKRNRRKYRMTVFSITISIILFLGTSSFSNYMVQTINVFDTASVFDIDFYLTKDEFKDGIDPERVKNDVANLNGVDKMAYTTFTSALLQLDTSQVTDDFMKLQKDYNIDFYKKIKSTGKITVPVFVTFVEDDIYEEYLKEHRLNVSRFMDTENLCPLIWDDIAYYKENGSVAKINILSGEANNGKFYFYKSGLDRTICNVTDPSSLTLEYDEESDDGEGEEPMKKATREEGLAEVSLAGAQKMDGKLPLGVTDMSWSYDNLRMTLPYSTLDKLPADVFPPDTIDFGILAKDHKTAYEEMTHFFQNSNNYSHAVATRIYDGKEERESMNALILVMDIFSYGFITLITLIVMANIFHTISTNIQLRRKEFASLKSIGMTKKGFDKMMNYECLLYGVKGLIYGLPISFLLCYLMSRSLQSAWNVPFMIPWLSVAIAVVSVFVIVFASMFYAMHKIKKDNPIDALRENV